MMGGVEIRVEGLMLERLLMRAMEEGACFLRVRRDGHRAIVLMANDPSAAIVLGLAERFSMPAQVLSTHGASTLWRWFKRRWTLLPALLLCAIAVAFLLSRVWFLDIVLASERSTPSDAASLEELLDAMDVHAGMPRSRVNPQALALELSARADGYSYVGVRLEGVRLLVETTPEVEAPEIFDVDFARDLVAGRDGVIVSITPQTGEACVKPGDVVRAGDVLIRGEEQLTREENRGVAAKGEVIARAWHSGEAVLPAYTVVKAYTGRESVSSSLCLFRWEIPLTQAETFAQQEVCQELLPVGGMFLPLMIRRITCLEYTEERLEADMSVLKRRLELLAMADAQAKIDPDGSNMCSILKKWIDYEMTEEGMLRARAVVEFTTDIATTREMLAQGG